MKVLCSIFLVFALLFFLWPKDKRVSNGGKDDQSTENFVRALEERRKQTEGRQRLESSSIAVLKDGSIPLKTRIDLMGKLDSQISESGFLANELYEVLSYTPPKKDAESWWMIVNEILSVLRKNNYTCPVFPERISAVIELRDSPLIVKEYALQHVGAWFSENFSCQKIGGNEEVATRVNSIMLRVFEDVPDIHSQYHRTALNVVSEMAQHVDGDELAVLLDKIKSMVSEYLKVERISEGSDVLKANRKTVSFLQTIGSLGWDEYKNDVTKVISSNDLHPIERISAIAALGSIGTKEDIKFLQEIMKNKIFSFAAESAIKKLSDKVY